MPKAPHPFSDINSVSPQPTEGKPRTSQGGEVASVQQGVSYRLVMHKIQTSPPAQAITIVQEKKFTLPFLQIATLCAESSALDASVQKVLAEKALTPTFEEAQTALQHPIEGGILSIIIGKLSELPLDQRLILARDSRIPVATQGKILQQIPHIPFHTALEFLVSEKYDTVALERDNITPIISEDGTPEMRYEVRQSVASSLPELSSEEMSIILRMNLPRSVIDITCAKIKSPSINSLIPILIDESIASEFKTSLLDSIDIRAAQIEEVADFLENERIPLEVREDFASSIRLYNQSLAKKLSSGNGFSIDSIHTTLSRPQGKMEQVMEIDIVGNLIKEQLEAFHVGVHIQHLQKNTPIPIHHIIQILLAAEQYFSPEAFLFMKTKYPLKDIVLIALSEEKAKQKNEQKGQGKSPTIDTQIITTILKE